MPLGLSVQFSNLFYHPQSVQFFAILQEQSNAGLSWIKKVKNKMWLWGVKSAWEILRKPSTVFITTMSGSSFLEFTMNKWHRCEMFCEEKKVLLAINFDSWTNIDLHFIKRKMGLEILRILRGRIFFRLKWKLKKVSKIQSFPPLFYECL